MWILNICDFASASEIGADFIFHKTNFENLKKMERSVNIFVFFIKIHVRAKNPPFLNNPPLVQPHPFWKKYFTPTLLATT